LSLTVRVADVRRLGLAAAECEARVLMVCDRCHDVEEIVVAVMEIVQLNQIWALCGICASELPKGLRAI